MYKHVIAPIVRDVTTLLMYIVATFIVNHSLVIVNIHVHRSEFGT